MIETRVCKKCGQEKSIDMFPINHPPRRLRTCKQCHSKTIRRKYQPSESRNSYKAQWRQSRGTEYREKDLLRKKADLKAAPLWYANALLGGTARKRYPSDLLLVKQLQMKIKHLIKGEL